MDKKIQEIIEWFSSTRNEMVSDIYIDKSSYLKELFLPDKKRTTISVLRGEADLALKSIARIKEEIHESKNQETLEMALDLMLTVLKNRSEYLSERSDFNVTYIALLAFTYTSVTLPIGLWMKMVVTFIFLAVFLFAVFKRVEMRREVAVTKELINILELYKKTTLEKYRLTSGFR